MKEDKVAIVKKLEELINLTRMGRVELNYVEHNGEEYVTITGFDSKDKICYTGAANVSMDSGVALIRDVMRHRHFR